MVVSFLRVADGVWWDSSDKYEEQRRVWGGGISQPGCLGGAQGLLGRVRLLLRLGSFERSVVGMLSVVPFARLE